MADLGEERRSVWRQAACFNGMPARFTTESTLLEKLRPICWGIPKITPCADAPASRAPRISRTPHVNMKSLYHSLLRNSRSGRHSESFFQLPSSNGEYGVRAA